MVKLTKIEYLFQVNPCKNMLRNMLDFSLLLCKYDLHSKKRTTCSGLMKTGFNNVVLPTLFKVVDKTEQVDEPELTCKISGVTMLNNIVNNLEQCGQQNIVQCCFHQARTGCAFFAVYNV